MKTALKNLLSKFSNKSEDLSAFQGRIRALRDARKAPRSSTFKPKSSCGHRGAPRYVKDRFAPAPTIDEVRRLERAYFCKLHVKMGLIYFRDGVPFSHDEARNRRLDRMGKLYEEVEKVLTDEEYAESVS